MPPTAPPPPPQHFSAAGRALVGQRLGWARLPCCRLWLRLRLSCCWRGGGGGAPQRSTARLTAQERSIVARACHSLSPCAPPATRARQSRRRVPPLEWLCHGMRREMKGEGAPRTYQVVVGGVARAEVDHRHLSARPPLRRQRQQQHLLLAGGGAAAAAAAAVSQVLQRRGGVDLAERHAHHLHAVGVPQPCRAPAR
jgi:hypothetical protein